MPETEAEANAAARANKRWQEAALALQLRECPVIELPLLRTLPDKSQQTVAQGLTAMLAQLRYEGFMVRRLHSDRGRPSKMEGLKVIMHVSKGKLALCFRELLCLRKIGPMPCAQPKQLCGHMR